MIAQRLRPIGWVASVAGAALGLYLVSLQVATERAALESVERKIAATEHEIRRLETEFAARASLRQLELYNGEVLALAAPSAKQYLTSEVQLAAFDPGLPGGGLPRRKPETALASAEVAAPAPARPELRPAVVTDSQEADAPVVPAARRAPVLQAVAYVEPLLRAAPARTPVAGPAPAGAAVAMLDSSTLSEIARRAAKEAKAETK
jgi:hypothetical protein